MQWTLGNERKEVSCDALGVGCQVLPGNPDDHPSGQREQPVTLAVGVEAGRRLVGSAAVEFDDDLGVGPGGVWVDGPVFDRQGAVEQRSWKVELLGPGLGSGAPALRG
jgi:hypothetical protein